MLYQSKALELELEDFHIPCYENSGIMRLGPLVHPIHERAEEVQLRKFTAKKACL